MKRLLLAAALAAFSCLAIPSNAQEAVRGKFAVCDPYQTNNCQAPGTASLRVFGSFVRPANTTAYASGQLVANSTTAGSVVPVPLTVARFNGNSGRIQRIKLSKTSTTLTNAVFRVHLYRNLPTPTNGDGGVWLTTSSVYLGAGDVTMDKAFTDEANGIATPLVGTQIVFDTTASSPTIYALVEARAAYTPASAETFVVSLEVVRD